MSGQSAEIALGERPPNELLEGASLFLDFDGTLVDIAPTPDRVIVTSELRKLLSALASSLKGRVAILSGRSAGEIRNLIDPLELVIGGSHGLEVHRPGGLQDRPERPRAVDRATAALIELGRKHEGVMVEEKPLGVAIHYRLAPAAEPICRAAVEGLAAAEKLEIQSGKMVFELKVGGADKGSALRSIMAHAPFKGSTPVVLGDDLTDEAAFRVAKELGGAGILIGHPRETAASYRLPTVAGSLAWLWEAGAGQQ